MKASSGPGAAVVLKHAIGKAGDVKDLQLRPLFSQTIGQISSIHAGHEHVSKKHVDCFGEVMGNLYGLFRKIGGEQTRVRHPQPAVCRHFCIVGRAYSGTNLGDAFLHYLGA